MLRLYILFFFLKSFLSGIAQELNNGTLKGRVIDVETNQSVPFANVVILETSRGVVTDIEGKFEFTGLTPGYIKLKASSVGFMARISSTVLVTNARTVFIEIALEQQAIKVGEVVVKPSPFRKTEESPVSLRSIGIDEIERNPGGNRDISKVIQSYPGVASSLTYRNDVIVRGGGPSENRFYLDGVEIPTINHFSTQGASGGPVGIINVDFVREVNFYSGAFPANRGNMMSSVLDFKQVDGNLEKMKFRATVGASDLALTMDGPLSTNTSLVFSARRSYLQFLFKAIGLPFLPTYNDVQFKIKSRLDDKNELTFIGLGAIDQFELNTGANETEEQRYILGYLPVNEQWSYTVGAVYKHFSKRGYRTFVLSRNRLTNTAFKYQDNVVVDSLLNFDYESYEIENHFRYEHDLKTGKNLKLNYGSGLDYIQYNNSTFQKIYFNQMLDTLLYYSQFDILKWSLFGQVSRPYFNRRVTLSLGFRMDANSFSSEMNNLFDQFSPRLSLSYQLTSAISLNFSTGRFFQLPPYTTMGFSNQKGDYINKRNGLKYIRVNQMVGGIGITPDNQSQYTLEGFFKNYGNYPFSVDDSVSIAGKGANYGVYGDEEVTSTGEGRAYGFEILARHKDFWGFNGVLAYTFVRSEFMDYQNKYIPSSWDNRHIITLTASRHFKKNWDLGFKWRFLGGAPYTPYDEQTSSLKKAWDAQGNGYLDYSRFNRNRLSAYNQLDIRIDKQYFFRKWSLMLYFDVQNLTGQKSPQPKDLMVVTDENGQKQTDPLDPSRYQLKYLDTSSGTVLPTVGIMVEF